MIFATTIAFAASLALFVIGMHGLITSLSTPVQRSRAQTMSAFHASLTGAQLPRYEYYS